MRHLPTNGGGPALTALLGNNSQVLVSSIAAAIAQIKAGKAARARLLRRRSARRRCPTCRRMKELGYDVEFYLWVGMFAPKGTPDAIVTKLRDEIQEGGATPTSSRRRSTTSARIVAYLDQPEFAQVLGRRRQARRGRRARHRQGVRMTARPAGERAGKRVILRTDHVAGGVFVARRPARLRASSGDLPFGTLALPGAGMMPKLVAGLMIAFGADR